MNNQNFIDIFSRLRQILQPYGEKSVIQKNDLDVFYLDTDFIMKNKKPLFFASVAIKKNYVSFHLMPVYVQPKLLENVSPELLKRMQGKSCFNFKKVENDLFEELTQLVDSGWESYIEQGYVNN